MLKNSFGSMVSGIDIEFDDALDGRHKYCQVKLGSNTIKKIEQQLAATPEIKKLAGH